MKDNPTRADGSDGFCENKIVLSLPIAVTYPAQSELITFSWIDSEMKGKEKIKGTARYMREPK